MHIQLCMDSQLVSKSACQIISDLNLLSPSIVLYHAFYIPHSTNEDCNDIVMIVECFLAFKVHHSVLALGNLPG